MSTPAVWVRRGRAAMAIIVGTGIGVGCAEQPVEESPSVIVDYQGRERQDPSMVAPFGELKLTGIRPGDLSRRGLMLLADSSPSGKSHFIRLVRHPGAGSDWTLMQADTAYTRDLYAGADWYIQNAQNGDSWQVVFTMPNGSTISSPELRFVDSIGSEHNCFISGLSRLCGFTGAMVQSYFSTQCGTHGNIRVDFTESLGIWGRDTFFVKDQIPDSSISLLNQLVHTTVEYDNQCKRVGRRGYFNCARDTAGTLLPGYSAATFANLGCALTTATNTLRYFGAAADPIALHAWMKDSGGFLPDGRVVWPRVRAYGRRQFQVDIGKPYYYDVGDHPTEAQFDSARVLLATQICRYGPANVKVFHPTQHWVTAFGRAPDTTTFLISDPAGGQRITMAGAGYANRPHRVIFWRKQSQPDPRQLGLLVMSPAEIVLTDPLGRRIGYDPSASVRYTEIPDAAYSLESIGGDEPGEDESTHETKDLVIPEPVDGTYQVQVIGTDTGSYDLVLDAQYMNEGSDRITLTAIPTWSGAVHSYSFVYSANGGQVPVLDRGSFRGGGQSTEADELLTYSSPGTKSTTVPPEIDSVQIAVYLSTDVVPTTTSFIWNGLNVTPAGLVAGKTARLTLPLTSGRNIFLASTDGLIGGRRKSDSDHLVFIH